MQQSSVISKSSCYHCGETCNDEPLMLEDKTFCCEGCKTVFQILNEHNMCSYYQFDERAGNTVTSGIARKRFEYLQDIDVEHKLVDFKNGSTTSVTFFIPNIHCTSCVWLLENLGNIDSGILKGTVNFMKRTVTFLYDDASTSLRAIVELLTTIGYEPNLTLDQLDKKESGTIDRSLWLKLGVAGFCFGNIMLFSFPEYLKMDQSGSSEMFRYFFGGLNILLSLPVLFYSSIDYLKSAWAALSQRGVNLDVPISIGLLTLFGRSLYEILSGTGAGYFDTFTGFIFFLLIGKVVQQKTFARLSFDRDYKSYLPISVIKLIGTSEESIPVDKLEIGDRVLLRNQELIPADAVLDSEQAAIDYSFITGETEPVSVVKGTKVFAGGKIIGCNAEFLIAKKVEHSYLTQLWENEAFTKRAEEKIITSFADRISPHFTLTVLAIAIVSLLVWLQIDASKAFTIFTAVLIVACPCALALSTPFTLGAAVNILSLNGLYVRSSNVLEALSRATTFVFDKTGTITESEKSEVRFIGTDLSEDEKIFVKSTVKQSIHPLSKIITKSLTQETKLPNFVEEIPGKGLKAHFGKVVVLIGSKSFLAEHSSSSISGFVNTNSAGSLVHVMISDSYKGAFLLENKLRDGIQDVLATLGRQQDVYLVSGDNEAEGKKLKEAYPFWTEMLFNQSPVQKLEVIDRLHQKKEHVVMIGDGLNDAGALKASDFGIAISDDMSSFSPACDAIAESASLKNLATLVDFSRSAFRIIVASFGISLMYNLTGLGFAITGNLSPLVAAIIMPLSSVSVMAFTNIATRIKANQMKLKIWA
ncbi:MAG: heavy metal translocating P-type ATPase metal-binding domain-containing protein [Balneolaceae bacterium]|nr:heavy metal translocating P-type ATPase metal-binding domain-containing protein [Balneolaceae bacterium]